MTEQPINYLSVLADLEARRDRLNAAIAAVKQILGEIEPRPLDGIRTFAAPLAAQSMRPAATYRNMTIGDAAVAFLRSVGHRQSMAEIVRGIRAGGISSKSKNVYTTTFNVMTGRAKRPNSDVVKIGSEWGLKEWGEQS